MIYDNIKELAEKRGLTIQELETLAGLSNGTIGKWRNTSPTVGNLKKVADILHVTVNRLIREKTCGEQGIPFQDIPR